MSPTLPQPAPLQAVGPNSRRAGGGSGARAVEAAGGHGWAPRFPAALPPGLPQRDRLRLRGETAVELASHTGEPAWWWEARAAGRGSS